MRQRSGTGAEPSHERGFYEALGRALKVMRAERGLKRKELAAIAGLSYPYLSEIEGGKKRPSSRAVLALADALGVQAHELMETAETLRASGRTPGGGRTTVKGAAPAPPRSPFFHAQRLPTPTEAVASPPPAAAWAEVAEMDETEPPDRAALRARLRELVEDLSEDDLHRLVDLARRLAH